MESTVNERLVRVSTALKTAGIPLTAAHITRLIQMGKVAGKRIGHLYYTSPSALLALIEPKS